MSGSRRLLRTVIRLCIAGSWGLSACVSAAQACSSTEPPQSQAQLFTRASAVFTAHLLRTEEIAATTAQMTEVEATFRTIEIFKGQPPAEAKVRTFTYGPGNCSVPLLAGSDYLFFLYGNNRVLLLPGGSQLFWNLEGTEAKKILEELRELARKTP